jgi:Fe-S cluster assembly protein SufB
MSTDTLDRAVSQPYKYGFKTEIEYEEFPRGLNEDIIRMIVEKKNEPEFMLDFRLRAFRQWQKMTEPEWANLNHPPIDYQKIIYYSTPKKKPTLNSLDEVDPKILETYEKLGIPLS